MPKKTSKHTMDPMDQFMEMHSQELPLGTQLAIVAMSRVLRPVLHKTSRFVVSAVVPSGANVYFYTAAAHSLLERRRDGSVIRDHSEVIVVKDPGDLADVTSLTKLNECRRAVVLLASEDLMTDHIRLLSDLAVSLPLPTARDIKIAAMRMGFGRLKDKDAEFLGTQDITRLSLVMRHGRSVEAMVARLRRHPEKRDSLSEGPTDKGPTLHELHGFGPAKSWGLELATDLADWKAGKLPWDEVDRGLLLSGPPGCGKTSYAAALARTCGVHLVLASAARWQAMGHLGDLLKAMRRAFDEAKKKSPSIVFIDEFDSFADREALTGDNASYSRQVVNGLLECLDGVQDREGVVVIGATNYPDLVDPALLRPGRLERRCEIPLPDLKARTGIFRFHLRRDLESSTLEIPARRSERWTGADIERCVRDAKRLARRARRPMVVADLVAAMPARTELSAEMLRSVAVHEVGHAIVGVLAEADKLVSVSVEDNIDPNAPASALGGTAFQEQPIRRKTSTYFKNKIAVLLAGMAAERIVFGDHSTGAAGHREADLNQATDLATLMEMTWGLGESLTSEVCNSPDVLANMRLQKPGLSNVVEATLRKEMARAEEMLESRRDLLLLLADTLIARKRLTAEEIIEAVEGDGGFVSVRLSRAV